MGIELSSPGFGFHFSVNAAEVGIGHFWQPCAIEESTSQRKTPVSFTSPKSLFTSPSSFGLASSFGFFHKMIQKTDVNFFGQPNKFWSFPSGTSWIVVLSLCVWVMEADEPRVKQCISTPEQNF